MEKRFEFKVADKNSEWNGCRLVIELNVERGECFSWLTPDIKVADTVFSACGYVYKRNRCIAGGQCLDNEVFTYAAEHDETFKRIISIWKKYHLNDMRAGTKVQTEVIESAIKNGELADYDYTKVCDYLKSKNLYEDNGYVYGTKWLFEKIPYEVKEDLFSIVY